MNTNLQVAPVILWTAICLGGHPLGARAERPTVEQQAVAWLGEVRLPTKNYVQDGSFEFGQRWVWFEHKTGGVENGTAATGKNAFHMIGNDPNRHFYFHQYDVPLETGKTYTLSAMLKTNGLSKARCEHGVLFLCNYGWEADSISLPAPQTTMGWTRVSKTFVAPRTKPRADGKPTYTLTIYWPPKSEGEFWLDDIQIEEGDIPTAFSDAYVGDGIKALEQLKRLAAQIFATQESLGEFQPSDLIQTLTQEVAAILGQAEALRDDIKQMDKLSKSAREALVNRVEAVSIRLAKVRTVVWSGSAYTPLKDVAMPKARPKKLEIAITCLKGEHRDFAVNVANLTPKGYPSRLIVSDLHNESLAWWVSPDRWMTGYSAPRMRGFSKPAEVFTDALPELDRGGIFYVEPAGISQAIISIDTSTLLPGQYTATISVASLVDAANRQEIAIKVHVLGQALLPLTKVDIVECFGHTPYAWEAMMQLGVNTFDLEASWMDVEFNDDGSLNRSEFSRIDENIRHALAHVPDARFVTFSGQGIFEFLERRYGWKVQEPRFKKAFKAWIRALVDHLGTLKVASSRMVIETYDEPGEGDFAAGTRMAQWIRQVDPAIQTQYYVTGIGRDKGWRNNALAHTIVGPIVSSCTPENMQFLKSLGRKLWVYDCQADGESFNPTAYYRLMPWTCRKYGVTGWGHFSWFNSAHGFGRGYRPWDGVETQNLVYPALDGRGMVISRRFLAQRAGQEDYQLLDALDTAMAKARKEPASIETNRKYLEEVYDRALSLSPRDRGYQTHIKSGTSADLLDRIRQDVVERIETLLPAPRELAMTLDATNTLSVHMPDTGTLRVRYLVNGKLPWQAQQRQVVAGDTKLALETMGEVNRCLVDFTDQAGRVSAGTPLVIPRIRVDSTSLPYSPRSLNDGLRVAAVKFEPDAAWISAPTAVEHWVEMNLGRSRSVSQVTLFWMTFTGLPQKTMVQYADEAGTWKPVSATPVFRPAAGAMEIIRFSPVTTSKLRVLQAPNGGGNGGPSLMGLSEVEAR
jgi:hypothetical protein